MSGERSLRHARIAAMANARLAHRLALVNDMFNPGPDPLKDTFENAFFTADSHGHRYGAECADPYCAKLYAALTAALPPAAAAVQAPPPGGK